MRQENEVMLAQVEREAKLSGLKSVAEKIKELARTPSQVELDQGRSKGRRSEE
jgi:hypothetical protein